MIQIVAVGKIKEKAMKQLIEEYSKRISAYSKLEIAEVDDEPNLNNMDDSVRQIEGERILKQIRKDSFVVLLDLKGKTLSSEELAEKISWINTYRSSNITFVIGGSLGVSRQVKERADFMLKMSDMTFPHNLARLIILEQIYRSYKILNHEPYHK